jgi:CIC family chloride channel protein
MPVASKLALLPAYVVLGGIMAVASAVFIRALYGAEDFFEGWIPKREYLRHVIGMLGVGVMAVTFVRLTGHYYVEGVGYSTSFDILSGTLDSVGLLLVLLAAKLVATSLTLGSGASGGIFLPRFLWAQRLAPPTGWGCAASCRGCRSWLRRSPLRGW